MIKTQTLEEYKEASKDLKFIPTLEKCPCGETINITNEWVAIEPLPDNMTGIDADLTMICKCKKCESLYMTEYNFAKTRWSVFGTQYFYLEDINDKMREEIAGKKRE